MKKTALVLLGAAAASGACAQSSVTVFGVMDLAPRYVRNDGVGSISSVVSGANQTSRVGFRGVEDLGGGLTAGFWLESGLAADTGTAGQTAPANQFWDRRATLSLSQNNLGELRLGRDFVPTYLSWGRFDPFGFVGVANSANFISATPNGPIRSAFSTSPNVTLRSSNAVQYLLPGTLGGVQGGVMVAAGEGGTAANGQHKHVGGRIGYAAGPLVVSASYGTTENNTTAGEKFTDAVIGASYNFGVVRLSAAVRQFEFLAAEQRNLLVGVVVPVGAGSVLASFNKVDASGSVGATSLEAIDATQWGLGYVHNLSKRTALYATASRIDNRSGANYVIPGGPSGMANGRNSTGFEAGVRHNF